jgi:hypothetical protein
LHNTVRWPYILLFAALSVVYHSNLRPIASGDSLPASLIPFSIWLDHTVRLDRFGPWVEAHQEYSSAVVRIRGHYYSGYPIAGPVLATPLYFPLVALRSLGNWDPGALIALARILEKFAATSIAAFSAVLMLLLLRRLTSDSWAWGLTLVYALGTVAWSTSSQAMWQHTTGQLAIVGALFFLERWAGQRDSWAAPWYCGACTACALMIRPSNIVLLPALVAALFAIRVKAAEYLRLLILPFAGGLLVLGYNLLVFRNASGAYPLSWFDGDLLEGVGGILLSPGRGLLIYSPVALFALCSLLPKAAIARHKHTALFVASIVFAVLHGLAIAKFRFWWGGYCWGPRLLAEIMPPLLVLMALGTPALEGPWARRSFAVLAIYGCLIQALGVYFYPKGHWDNLPVSVDQAPGRLWDWKDNPIGRTAAAGPVWEQYAIVRAALSGGTAGAAQRMRELEINPF